jgi:hypothetical protein
VWLWQKEWNGPLNAPHTRGLQPVVMIGCLGTSYQAIKLFRLIVQIFAKKPLFAILTKR